MLFIPKDLNNMREKIKPKNMKGEVSYILQIPTLYYYDIIVL